MSINDILIALCCLYFLFLFVLATRMIAHNIRMER